MKNFLALLCSAILALAFVACSDDDSFTSSPSHLLTFSQDTVRLDTVFSKVPTPTKSFWVYNRSGDGIRCSNIRLANGNQTGFRVNVDGSYLGASSGYQINDLEIRKNDSIRVFVELTSPANNQEKPTLLQDDLLFSLESGAQQKVNLRAFTWDAEMHTDWVITENTTINTSIPIIVYGGLTVAEGVTLTLSEGTTIYFHADAEFNVYGQLVAQGSPEKNVVLRGDRIDNMFDYLPYDNVSGQWPGIHFHEKSYDNELNYVDIHSARDAIVCDSSDVSRLKLALYNSVVHNNEGYGLKTIHSVVDVRNCQITNALGDCVSVCGGVCLLQHCTIGQFYPFSANRGVALRFSNFNDKGVYPLYDFQCVNTLVTGYADDVIMGEADETAPYTYKFDHCVLRTPAIEDAERIIGVTWEDPEKTDSVGTKHFALIDTDNLRYDFRLDSLSLAIGAANKEEALEYDRLGVKRDDEPDVGCYEYVKQE
ncbi:MAG: right-handed parallel beta-helix repeat-containing protein [Prevotella sp.]|nr:right-handed parallel beta-helix repeat-containing protein [Prevotella sp.]